MSDLGRVVSLLTTRGKPREEPLPLSISTNKDGYLTVQLTKDYRTRTHQVSRLVAKAFIPNPLGLPEVNHKNLDKKDNSKGNLEWMTHDGNMKHATASGSYDRIKVWIKKPEEMLPS